MGGLCTKQQHVNESFVEPEPVAPVSAENVTIAVDDAYDEVELPIQGEDYPPAEPPIRQDDKPSVRWYEEEEDEFSSDVYESEEMGSTTSLDETERRLIGRIKETGIQLADMDRHAKSAARTDAESFDTLLGYLTKIITHENKRDLLIVRATTTWLCNQDVETGQHGRATTDTPNGYLQMQKEKRATFASHFAALCRYAGIQCTIIHGICRGGNYQPGDDEVQDCIWVSVRVDGNWQLIHPYWVCRSMVGQTLGGWVKLESGGKSIAKAEQETSGTIHTAFKESYFMPRPEDFKYMCYPDEHEWQLLSEDQRVNSKREFLNLPYLLPAFFGLGLTLVSASTCVMESDGGKIEIVILCQRKMAHKMVMTYDLYIKDVINLEHEMLQENTLPRLVLNTRAEEKFRFQIRFPVEGTYKIVLYAGKYRKHMLRVCEFKLSCMSRLPNCQLLPINTGANGWGPGPRAENAGLVLPTYTTGVINVPLPAEVPTRGKPFEEERAADIRFALHEDALRNNDYSAEMVSGGKAAEVKNQNENVHCEVNEDKKELQIRATVTKEGEYGLVIKAGKKGKQQRAVCNYLLTTDQAVREGVPQRKARRALKAALAGNVLHEELANVISKCHKVKISENDDDVRAAANRLQFLKVKSDLAECHKRRNLDVTKRTLKKVEKYRHKLALIIETRRVDKLKQQLDKLGGFTREVPALKEASEELVYTKIPSPEVMLTMTALFMLLEEPPDTLKEWSHIQHLLKFSHDHKNNVLNRMARITERQMDAKTRRKISDILHTYPEGQVRHASQAAASFYKWVDGVLVVYGQERTDITLGGESYVSATDVDADVDADTDQ